MRITRSAVWGLRPHWAALWDTTDRAVAHIPWPSAPWYRLGRSARCLSQTPPVRIKNMKSVKPSSTCFTPWAQRLLSQYTASRIKDIPNFYITSSNLIRELHFNHNVVFTVFDSKHTHEVRSDTVKQWTQKTTNQEGSGEISTGHWYALHPSSRLSRPRPVPSPQGHTGHRKTLHLQEQLGSRDLNFTVSPLVKLDEH